MKRKALSELFRSLKRIGVSQRVSVSELTPLLSAMEVPHLDVRCLMKDAEYPAAAIDSLGEAWDKSCRYHVQILAKVAHLRKIIPEAHEELGSKQARFCLGFVESLLNAQKSQRTLIMQLVSEFRTDFWTV